MKKGLCLLIVCLFMMTMIFVSCDQREEHNETTGAITTEAEVLDVTESQTTKPGTTEKGTTAPETTESGTDNPTPNYSEGLQFEANGDGTCTVTGIGSCSDTDVIIPLKSPDGDIVTSLGELAFSGCTGLTSITIPDSVTNIDNTVFYECTGLTSITIPDSVVSIGTGAFATASGLESIIVGEGNTIYHSMNDCLIETSTNTLIAGCKNSVIPDYVTSIGIFAFYGCTGLTSITVPDSVTIIENNAFNGCTGLVDIAVGENNTTYFAYDGILYLKANNSILIVPEKITGDVRIADGVTTIEWKTFERRTGLTSIMIPDSVTSIGNNAFEDCTGLTSVIIGKGLTSINNNVFEGCTALTSIIVSEGNSKYHSAGNCLIETESKTLITGCNTSVIPMDGSVTSIGDYAFYNCDGLTSITIPESVTSIGLAFVGCSGLESIIVSEKNTVYHSEGNCIIETGTDALILGCKTSQIPDNITGIYFGAFYGCTGLTSITIPDSVTSISDFAFARTGLTSITISDNVTSIKIGAFSDCVGLTDIYYTGSESEWAAMEIADHNEALVNATIHYNYVPEE